MIDFPASDDSLSRLDLPSGSRNPDRSDIVARAVALSDEYGRKYDEYMQMAVPKGEDARSALARAGEALSEATKKVLESLSSAEVEHLLVIAQQRVPADEWPSSEHLNKLNQGEWVARWIAGGALKYPDDFPQ